MLVIEIIEYKGFKIVVSGVDGQGWIKVVQGGVNIYKILQIKVRVFVVGGEGFCNSNLLVLRK